MVEEFVRQIKIAMLHNIASFLEVCEAVGLERFPENGDQAPLSLAQAYATLNAYCSECEQIHPKPLDSERKQYWQQHDLVGILRESIGLALDIRAGRIVELDSNATEELGKLITLFPAVFPEVSTDALLNLEPNNPADNHVPGEMVANMLRFTQYMDQLSEQLMHAKRPLFFVDEMIGNRRVGYFIIDPDAPPAYPTILSNVIAMGGVTPAWIEDEEFEELGIDHAEAIEQTAVLAAFMINSTEPIFQNDQQLQDMSQNVWLSYIGWQDQLQKERKQREQDRVIASEPATPSMPEQDELLTVEHVAPAIVPAEEEPSPVIHIHPVSPMRLENARHFQDLARTFIYELHHLSGLLEDDDPLAPILDTRRIADEPYRCVVIPGQEGESNTILFTDLIQQVLHMGHVRPALAGEEFAAYHLSMHQAVEQLGQIAAYIPTIDDPRIRNNDHFIAMANEIQTNITQGIADYVRPEYRSGGRGASYRRRISGEPENGNGGSTPPSR